MGSRTAARVACGLWGLEVVLAAGAVFFLVLGRSTPPPAGTFGCWGFAALFAVVFGTVGALIASRQPRNTIGWLLLASGVGSGLQELGQPDGRLPSRRWRSAVAILLPGVGLASIGPAFAPGPLQAFQVVRNPFGVGRAGVMSAAGGIGLLLYLIGIMTAAASIVVRLRRARGEERLQMERIALGVGIALSVLAVTFVLQIPAFGKQVIPRPLQWLTVLAFAGIGVATGIAFLKYRLYEIDVVISKTILLILLAGVISLVYVGLVVGIGTAIGNRSSAVLSAVAAAVAAVGFQPLRWRETGFDPSRAARGTGTREMVDRIETLGGTLRISSRPGEATAVVGHLEAEERG